MDNVLISMEGIEKQFPGVHALAQCRFELRAGEVHALVGENGAPRRLLLSARAVEQIARFKIGGIAPQGGLGAGLFAVVFGRPVVLLRGNLHRHKKKHDGKTCREWKVASMNSVHDLE